MSLVPSQAMIFSNKRGSGDYLYFMAVIPGDVFPQAVAGGSPCPCNAGRVGGSTQGWGTSVPSRGVGGRDALRTRLQRCRQGRAGQSPPSLLRAP